MEDFDPSIINENLNSGYFKDPQTGFPQRVRDLRFPNKFHPVGISAGVIKSVSEIFGSNDSLTIWSKIDLRKEQGELLSLVSTRDGE